MREGANWGLRRTYYKLTFIPITSLRYIEGYSQGRKHQFISAYYFLHPFRPCPSFPFPLSFPGREVTPQIHLRDMGKRCFASSCGVRTTFAVTRHVPWALNTQKCVVFSVHIFLKLCLGILQYKPFSCILITSAKEVMFYPAFVCLSVCLFVNAKTTDRIFMKILPEMYQKQRIRKNW